MEKLLLRQLQNEDVALFENWLYSPHVAKWYHDPLDWIDEVRKRNDEFSFLRHFILEAENRPIGFCQYYEYRHSGEDWHGSTDINGTYSIDYLIGDAAYLGKGFGKKMIQLLIKKIELQNGAKRIIAQPEQENKASCNTLLSCGFTFDGNNEIYVMEV